MGIFSFGKKNAESSGRSGGRSRAAGSDERSRGRGRESSRESARETDDDRFERPASTRRSRTVGQEAMLDPTLPEKQRARRRLVGAIALVLAAVIILPMVLDSHPKPVTDDIAISIPERDRATAQAASPRAASGADTQATNATDGVAPDAAPGTTDAGNVANNAARSDSGSSANTGVAKVAKVDAAPSTGAATARTQRQTGDTATNAAINATNAAKANVSPTPPARTAAMNSAANATANLTAKATGTPSRAVTPPAAASAAALPPTPATPGSRYVVQLGAFESDAAAREWVGKLKNIGVPAYVEQVRQPDGSNRVMLRAGPFADRSIAQAAVTKVRQAGLSQAGR